RRRHTSFSRDWSSDVCSSDLGVSSGMDCQAWRMLAAAEWNSCALVDCRLKWESLLATRSLPFSRACPPVSRSASPLTALSGDAGSVAVTSAAEPERDEPSFTMAAPPMTPPAPLVVVDTDCGEK